MTVLGITGPTGAGKTTLLREVEKLGGAVIDCDAVYHEMLKSDITLQDMLEREFGPLRDEGGAIDRKKLGGIVFGDPEKLEALNAIAWKGITRRVRDILEECGQQGRTLAAIDAIALFEGGLAELCQYTIAITAPWEDRITRLMGRESISRDYAEARLRAQHNGSYFQHLCDFTLDNSGAKDAFYQTARTLILQLLNSAPNCGRVFDHTNPKPTIFKEDHHE